MSTSSTPTKAEVVDSSTGRTTGTSIVKNNGTTVRKTRAKRKPVYKSPQKPGQTALTPALAASIVDSVREGMPYTLACHLHRVPQSTGSQWLSKGEEDPSSTWGDYAIDIRQAQAEFVREAINSIKDSGLKDARQWTALMTLLERIYPEYFKRPSDRGDINIGIQVNLEEKLHRLHQEGVIEYSGG